jgi:hypothetical protein
VAGGGGTYMNVRADGGTHEVLIGADGAGGIVSTMTNHDLQLRAGGNITRVWVKAGGAVGIGTATPARTLHVSGHARKDVGGDRWEFLSDARMKTNIAAVGDALQRLLRLRGVTFEWDDAERRRSEAGPQYGFVAQEVEPVFPEWVSEGEDGYKSLNLSGFEAVVVEALRELKASVDELSGRVAKLEEAKPVPPPRSRGKSER